MKLFILAACLAVCSAHMCLISPRQRGSMQKLNTAGADDCILTNAPCGGRLATVPETTWQSGGNFTVIFQKNLDHWLKATPGYFDVSILIGTTVQSLQKVPDMGEESLHLYTVTGTLPNLNPTTYQIQVQYVPKNSQAPATFYQCADIMVK